MDGCGQRLAGLDHALPLARAVGHEQQSPNLVQAPAQGVEPGLTMTPPAVDPEVWYSYNDNNTITHPGAGLVLPVDARPTPIKFPSGALLGNRRQPFDATFGQEATDAVTFHLNGVPVTVPSSAGIPTFDDTDPNRYWSSGNPRGSVKVAGTGTSMTVTNSRDGGNELQVHVAFAG